MLSSWSVQAFATLDQIAFTCLLHCVRMLNVMKPLAAICFVLLCATGAAESAVIASGVYPTGLIVDQPGEDITQDGAVTVVGNTRLVGENITLTSTANDFDTVSILSSGFVALTDANGLSGDINAQSGITLQIGASAGVFNEFSTLSSRGDVDIVSTLLSTIDVTVPTAATWHIGGILTFQTDANVQVRTSAGIGDVSLLRDVIDVKGDIRVVNSQNVVTQISPAPTPIPLPATMWFALSSFAALGFVRRRRA